VFRDRQNVARVESLFGRHAESVHLDAVATVLVADVPIAAVDEQLTVMGRNIRESQNNVATLATANEQILFEQRYWVTTALRDEFAKHKVSLVEAPEPILMAAPLASLLPSTQNPWEPVIDNAGHSKIQKTMNAATSYLF
jgi:hypothetical protein